MKKLLTLLGSCVLFSLFALPAMTGPAALAQDNFGPPTDLEFDIEGDEFDFDAMRQVDQEGAAAAGAAAGVLGLIWMLFWLAVMVLMIAALWVTFTKAGKPGWAAIIPIYNMIVVLEVCGRPIWWILLLLIPCVNIVVAAIVWIDFAKSFGKDVLFGIGLWLLGFVFLPILAFGSAQYQGPAAAEGK